MKKVRYKSLGMRAKRRLYKGIVVSTALNGVQTWNMEATEREKLNVGELRHLRSMCATTKMYQVRNEEVQRRNGVIRDLAD